MRPMHMGMRPVCGGGGMATDWSGPVTAGKGSPACGAERALGLRRRGCHVRSYLGDHSDGQRCSLGGVLISVTRSP